KKDQADIHSDLWNVEKLEGLLKRFDAARADRDPASLIEVQADLRQLVVLETDRDKEEVKADRAAGEPGEAHFDAKQIARHHAIPAELDGPPGPRGRRAVLPPRQLLVELLAMARTALAHDVHEKHVDQSKVRKDVHETREDSQGR